MDRNQRRYRNRQVFVAFIFGVIVAMTFQARAQQSVISSGGVSLGAYKAGFIYFLTQAAALNPRQLKFHQFAGASAGGVNSLLAIHTLCHPRPQAVDKHQSSFWKLWVENGINEIFDENLVTELSLFHRKAFDSIYQQIIQDFQGPLPKGCDFTLSIPVTSTQAFNQFKDQRVFIPALRQFFVIRIQGSNRGTGPKFSNVNLDKVTNDQVLLPFSENTDENWGLVKKVILATSAFPIAFEPVAIRVCDNSTKNCNQQNAQEKTYFDGGIFDNAPLGLAADVEKKIGPKKTGSIKKFFYLNSSNGAFSILEGDEKMVESEALSLTDMLKSYLFNLQVASRNNEEASLVLNQPDVINSTLASRTTLPPASSPFYAFLGFYDRTFREFDFEMGMSDARDFLIRYDKFASWNWPALGNPQLETCFRALRIEAESFPGADCQTQFPQLDPNLKILFQLSVNRAFQFCSNNADRVAKDPKYRRQCQNYLNLSAPPNLIQSSQFDSIWPIQTKNGVAESDIHYYFRNLDQMGFKFTDLDQKYAGRSTGLEKLYDSQKEMISVFRARQPTKQATIMGLVESQILKSIDDSPPQKTVFLNLGSSIELGVRTALNKIPKWISFEASVLTFDYASLLGSQPDNIAVIPSVGLAVAPTGLRYENAQLSFGLNYGYQFASRDQRGSKPCDVAEYEIRPTTCSTQALIVSSGLAFYDRFNIKVGFAAYDKKNLEETPTTGFLMMGYQFY